MVVHPSVPILYGSIATKVANASKIHPEHTHTWDVYVKCPNDRDLGKIVKKVVFKLHDSFTHPNRTVDKAPYSVTESGWGEFEIQIKIHWVDPREKPVSFYHLLKLYPNDTTLAKENSIISEFYDEIVFPNASSAMHQAIEAFNSSGSGWSFHLFSFLWDHGITTGKIIFCKW
eukprot:m.103105 g.103105  ORF g.103105 m.103105 type:complete len:173 (-) comp16838_c0_seq4:964-1482(-)